MNEQINKALEEARLQNQSKNELQDDLNQFIDKFVKENFELDENGKIIVKANGLTGNTKQNNEESNS